MQATSAIFDLSISSSSLSKPGDAILLNPALITGSGVHVSTKLVTKDGTWTAGPNHQALLNGVNTNQPYADAEVLYLNSTSTVWLRSPTKGYACWNSTANTWNWANCSGTGGSAPL